MAIKFSLPQSELARAAQTVNQAVPTRSTLPALMNFHVEVDADGLRLTATDLDTSVSLRLACEDAVPGRTLIPARLFTDLVKNLPADLVTVESEGESVRISSKGGEFSLPTADPDDYPQLPRLEEERTVTLSGKLFAGLVGKVVDFVSAEDSRPEMSGVKVEFHKKELRMVGINGHMMAMAAVDGDFQKGDDVIVLPSALQYAVHGLGQGDDVTLGIARTQIVFQLGKMTVFSRLLEGKFPDYEKVLPDDNPKKAVVRRDEILAALKRVDVVADNITHQVRFRFAEGMLELDAQQSVGGGRAHVKIEAQYDAEPLEIGFNAKYVMDVIKTLDAEEARFALDRPLSAMVVTPEPAPQSGRHVCLVMPLRLPSTAKA
jgi:DNA polymerase-3 subunit beta